MSKLLILGLLALLSFGTSLADGPRHLSTSVEFSGDIDQPASLSADEIAKLPHTTVNLTEENGTQTAYSGVPFLELMKRFKLFSGEHIKGKALATYVLVTAKDGYQVVFGLGELDPVISGRTVILADQVAGAPLNEKLGPFRIVVGDDKKQARCIRMVTGVRFVKLRK